MENFASKISIIKSTFVRTADDNYITARWCAFNSSPVDFSWLSLHALEKYMKAVILLNGASVKSYGHNIISLFKDITRDYSNFIPSKLTKPDQLDLHMWEDIDTDRFIANLNYIGNPDNRYHLFGTLTFSRHIYYLDLLVFHIRRLICRVDDEIFADDEAPRITNRDILKSNEKYYHNLGMPLDDLIRAREKSLKQFFALNQNFPFAPPVFSHQHLGEWHQFEQPVLIREVIEPLKNNDPSVVSEALEVSSWLLANVKLPGSAAQPGLKQQIERAVRAARATLD